MQGCWVLQLTAGLPTTLPTSLSPPPPALRWSPSATDFPLHVPVICLCVLRSGLLRGPGLSLSVGGSFTLLCSAPLRHTHTHAHSHTHSHTYTYAQRLVLTHAYRHSHTHVLTHSHTHTHPLSQIHLRVKMKGSLHKAENRYGISVHNVRTVDREDLGSREGQSLQVMVA